MIEVVAYYGPRDAPRKGKRKAVEISADAFFGRKVHGAPTSGDALIRLIEQLRRVK